MNTHSTTTNITLLQLPELIRLGIRLVHIAQRDVHKVVARGEMSVVRLAILQFHQLERSRRGESCRQRYNSVLVYECGGVD